MVDQSEYPGIDLSICANVAYDKADILFHYERDNVFNQLCSHTGTHNKWLPLLQTLIH